VQRYAKTDGKWERTAIEAFDSLEAAIAARDKYREEKKNGITVSPGKMTVTSLLDYWLQNRVIGQKHRAERTVEGYKSIITCHLNFALGSLPLGRLTPDVIQAYLTSKDAEGKSPRTCQSHYRLLSSACKEGVRKHFLRANPCDGVDCPEQPPKEKISFSKTDMRRVEEAIEGHEFHSLYLTLLRTGLRESESLGLRWKDVDLLGLTISVNQTLFKRRGVVAFKSPKTAGSQGTIPLAVGLAKHLREEYLPKSEWLALQLGRVLTPDSLVFCKPSGEPLDPSKVSHEFRKIADSIGMPHVHVHSLRHMAGTAIINQTGNLALASKILRHSNVAVTADIYYNPDMGAMRKGVAALEDYMAEPVSSKKL
jgi:integrase